MKVDKILQDKQPEVYKKLKNPKNKRRKKQKLSFNDFENMMRHDSYSRHHGAISQNRWGNEK